MKYAYWGCLLHGGGAAHVLGTHQSFDVGWQDALRGQGEILQQATASARRVSPLLGLQPMVATAQMDCAKALPAGPLGVVFDYVSSQDVQLSQTAVTQGDNLLLTFPHLD